VPSTLAGPKPRLNELDGSTWLRYSISVWSDIRKDKEDRVPHPAPFPLALARRVVEIFTLPGDLVIDPMCGSGTTLLAALRLGRRALGIDLNPAYVDFANERCGARVAVADDARNLLRHVAPASARLCLTSPPYWDVMSRRRGVFGGPPRPYSRHPDDAANAPAYSTFLNAMAGIFAPVRTALRPGGTCVVVVMDIRRGPEFYPLHADLAYVLTGRCGFVLDDIIIWDRRQDYHAFVPLGYPTRFRVNKAHEYLLILSNPG
jgi:DNA modification methylase